MKSPTLPSFRPFALRLEALEERCCPSAASVLVASGTITITGDGKPDTITISDNGQGSVTAKITSASNQVLASASGTGLSQIKIDTQGGSDTLDYALTGTLAVKETLVVNAGGGNLQGTLDFSAGVNSRLSVELDGIGQGNDNLTTTFGALGSGANVSLLEHLGDGTSKFNTDFNGAVSAGAKVNLDVDGDAGYSRDTVNFASSVAGSVHLTETLGSGNNCVEVAFESGIAKGADVWTDIQGGAGNNQADLNFGAVTGASVHLTEALGKGTTSAKVVFGALSDAHVDVNIDGNAGNHSIRSSFAGIGANSWVHDLTSLGASTDTDLLTLDGNVQGNSDARFTIDTGTGNDTATVDVLGNIAADSRLAINVNASSGTKNETVNYSGLDAGSLTVNEHAGKNNATLAENLTFTGNDTGSLFARVYGGKGTDTLTLEVAGSPEKLNDSIEAYHGNTITPNSTAPIKYHA